jgi:hypothetical protein
MAMYCAQLTHKHIILLATYNTLAHVTLYIAQANIFSLHASIQTHVQNADLQTKKKKIVPYPNVHQTLMMITIRSAHIL